MNKTIIIVQCPDSKMRGFGNFKKACERLKLPYYFLKRQKATDTKPITHSGHNIYRVPVE